MSKKGGAAKTGGNTGNRPLAGANVEKQAIPSFEKGGIVEGNAPQGAIDETGESTLSLEKVEELLSKDPLTEGVAPLNEKLPITIARWELAQKAEREQHNMSAIEGAIHYGQAYKNYFHFVGLGFNLHGLNVIEVGPADFPALACCENFGLALIVEPMPSEILEQTCKEKGFRLINVPFESVNFNKAEGITEVWLFNVMQHVIDPEALIKEAKEVADRIRFFEPIDQPITDYHPHTYSLKDFQRWFGDVNLYVGGTVEGFHQADCVYGVWVK